MKNALLTVPTGSKVGLSTVSIGLVRALDRQGVRVGFMKPISQPIDSNDKIDRSTLFISNETPLEPPEPIPLDEARELLSQDKVELLMERIVHNFGLASENCDAIVVEGLLQTEQFPMGAMLNKRIAQTLSADVILVSRFRKQSLSVINRQLEIAALEYDGSIAGSLINKVDLESFNEETGLNYEHLSDLGRHLQRELPIFREKHVRLIGMIPMAPRLQAPRTQDVAKLIDARILFEGEIKSRRVFNISLCARTVPNMLKSLRSGNLIVTPGDRDDIIIAAAVAATNGAQLAGIVLTGDLEPNIDILKLCRKAWYTGLPVMRVTLSSFQAAHALSTMNPEIPIDDSERVNQAMDLVASSVDSAWVRNQLSAVVKSRLSPPAFRYMLAKRANKELERIVLPEGNEPRTIQAAIACQNRGIAHCVLIGSKEEIIEEAEALGVPLPESIEIIDPKEVRENYVPTLVEMRRHKNMTEKIACDHLTDNVVLATVMLAKNEVDGLVSGAEHSSANTVRPALQLIKTKPDAKIVSSIFFMCLPDQVLVYGDCAINPDPNSEELADIAIQTAESARAFGIEPIIAMISYSTLGSGAGADVDKVSEATRIVKETRPDLIIDGPLQYDAAAIAEVAAKKAPDSPVAGKANVFIFPDLNTGNTTYKAVQRSANVVSIGPMLQGLKKPVNDLSRGALVDDIIYTIALTAIQAQY